jgi:hypothetical protein
MGCVLTLSVVNLWFDLWSSTDTYGVMVCVLTLSVVDLWFDLWSSTKTPMIGVFVLDQMSNQRSTTLKVSTQTIIP